MKTLITNVQIVDGLGTKPFSGEVLILDGRIAKISAAPIIEVVDSVIDGNEKFLAPGFIDCHSHCDLANLLDDGMRDKIMQGVTSEVAGVCGLGVAPVKSTLRKQFRNNLIIGNCDVDWDWVSFKEYLHKLNRIGVENNLIPFAPHGVLRYFVKGNDSSALNNTEIELLKSELSKCFDAGANGVSLGMIYLPAIYSKKDEIIAVFEVAKKYDRLVMVHLRSESDEIVEALDEMIELAGDHVSKLHISHLKIIGMRNAHKLKAIFERIDRFHLKFDLYPFNFGSTTLLSIIPPHFFEGKTLDFVLDSFTDPGVRDEIAGYFEERAILKKVTPWDNIPALVGWENIFIADLEINTEYLGMSIADLSKDKGVDPISFTLALLKEEHGNVRMIDYFMSESLVEEIFLHSNAMIGTDTLLGGVKHPRVYGTFPKIIETFVFNRKLLPIEDAILKMTSLPAGLLGLRDRGCIREGAYADLVLFGSDFHLPRSVGDHSGLSHLWINGILKVKDGEYLKERPGTVLIK